MGFFPPFSPLLSFEQLALAVLPTSFHSHCCFRFSYWNWED